MKALPAIFIISLVSLLIACGKDKFETKPKLEIKDYSSKNIFPRPAGLPEEELRIRLNFFDKEGDLGEAPVVGIIRRLNILPLGPDQDKVDTISVPLPTFPDKSKGEISFTLGYGFLKESTVENDSLVFKFAVSDRAGNKSDTITSDMVVIHL